MPQMMPMNWLNLYIYMLIMIFMILIMIYFMKYNTVVKYKCKIKTYYMLMIKW